jgi:UTP--glucose-1-phosphate uridylyltransferase
MVKKVRKAVIVAAGLGKRMFPFTKIDSKLLIPILNKPIVLYLMEELKASGIEEVLIITNHPSKLQQFFTENKKLNRILEKLERSDLIRELHRIENLCKINYVRQEEPRGWVHAVSLAKNFVKNEPFALLFSDCLYKSTVPATKQLINKYYKKNKNIRSRENVRYVFKPNIFKIIENFSFILEDNNNNQNLFFKELVKRNDFYLFEIEGEYFDIGNPINLLKTLFAFAFEDWYYSKKLYDIFLEDNNLKKDFKKFYRVLIRNDNHENKRKK